MGVEDFEPERLAFELTSSATAFDPVGPSTVDIAARYLYGAPAPNLAAEGEISLRAASSLAAYPGYSFGRALIDRRYAARSLVCSSVSSAPQGGMNGERPSASPPMRMMSAK